MELTTKKSLVKSHSELSVSRQCELLGLNESTYYYKPEGPSAEKLAREEALMAAIDRWHTKMPYLGCRKLVAKLSADGIKTNRKEVKRFMDRMGIYAVYPKPNLSKRNKQHKVYPYLLRNKPIFLANQVWAADITYIKMKHSHMYLTAIIDWHSRFIVGWALSDTLDTAPVLKAVKQATERYGTPSIINSDQGCQFTSDEYTRFLARQGIRQSMDGKARWIDNVIIERWFRSLKHEDIYINEYSSPNALRRGIAAYIADYNYNRPHQSLDNEIGQRILNCIEDTGTMLKFKEFGDGKCPLMLESGLCFIHKELGAGYLCKTCATYPRVHSAFNNSLEYWLSLSCPEVVRHVLYRKNSMSFVEGLAATSAPPSTKPQDSDKALVRDALAKIISYRKLSLKEKLLYMGMFMRSVGKLNIYAPNYDRDLKKTVKNYTGSLKDARKSLALVVEKLGDKNDGSRFGSLIAVSLLASQVALPPKKHPVGIENEKYYTMMAGFHNEIRSGEIAKYLLETFDKKIVPYVNSKPWVFENYLMYALMSSRFLADSNDYAACFAGFAGEFVTMLTFSCMFHGSESFGDEEMVVAMYLFHRRVSHSPVLRKKLSEQFSDNLLVFLVNALGGIK